MTESYSTPLSSNQSNELLTILKKRFKKNMHRHFGIQWEHIEEKLLSQPKKLWSLKQMEETGGEPDLIIFDNQTNFYVYCDCSTESPKVRRSLCYDRPALESRKEHKPKNNAIDMAAQMGVKLLTEEQYNNLQKLENFDNKTSSWLLTPQSIRNLGGAIFGDLRYGRVFIYHNGAESYYAARGFRCYTEI
jgi:hypothetical protein